MTAPIPLLVTSSVPSLSQSDSHPTSSCLYAPPPPSLFLLFRLPVSLSFSSIQSPPCCLACSPAFPFSSCASFPSFHLSRFPPFLLLVSVPLLRSLFLPPLAQRRLLSRLSVALLYFGPPPFVSHHTLFYVHRSLLLQLPPSLCLLMSSFPLSPRNSFPLFP